MARATTTATSFGISHMGYSRKLAEIRTISTTSRSAKRI